MGNISRVLDFLSEARDEIISKDLFNKALKIGMSRDEIAKYSKKPDALEKLVQRKYEAKWKEEDKVSLKNTKSSNSDLKKKFKSSMNSGIKAAKWAMKHDIDKENKQDAAWDLADVVIDDLKSRFGKDFSWLAKEFNASKEALADSIYG